MVTRAGGGPAEIHEGYEAVTKGTAGRAWRRCAWQPPGRIITTLVGHRFPMLFIIRLCGAKECRAVFVGAQFEGRPKMIWRGSFPQCVVI